MWEQASIENWTRSLLGKSWTQLGNIWIIIELKRASWLRPPSKLLLGCLARTDLWVVLITQHLFVAYKLSPEHSMFCYYFSILYKRLSIILGGKKLLRNQNNCSRTVILTLVSLHDPPSTRTAHSFLLNKAISSLISENRILKYCFTKETIHNVYTFPFLITKDSKLIAFQYNITHHILPTNSSLFHAGISESDTCTLCKTEKQTIYHLLFLCTEYSVFGKNSPAGGP